MTDEWTADRLRAARISLAAGIVIFAGKLSAYLLTQSTAVLSDAAESVVNIVAGAVLLFSLVIASRPADSDHPYGHGKVEFFSAGMEGSFILCAALWIAVESVRALIAGPEIQRIDLGLVLLGSFGGLNALLGVYLVRTGRRTHSLALVADGRHVLTDAWTTLGVLVGLGAVWATGALWLDPVIALAVAANIVREGSKLVSEAVNGLMDKADPEMLAEIARTLEARRENEWIDVHGLRTWKSGAALHADLHLVVPRYLEAQALHEIHETLEQALHATSSPEHDVVAHFDPCRPRDCSICTMPSCPVRASRFRSRETWDVDWATRTDEAAEESAARRAAL